MGALRRNLGWSLSVGGILCAATITAVVAQQAVRNSLSTGRLPAGFPQNYPDFKTIPPKDDGGGPQQLPPGGDNRRSEVSPGTEGRPLPAPPVRERLRVAIVGALDASGDLLPQMVAELNELQPDLVLTTGDTFRGFADSPETYAADAHAARTALNKLTVPWYPCVGPREVLSGSLDPRDTRMAPLYQRYFGPRYYSLDIGETHIVVLDTEETPHGSATFSDAQLAWLRKDLDRTFRRARHIIAVMHRPAWQDERSNWPRVHEALVAFNRRPIVEIEGAGRPRGMGGGRVDAVFAAGDAYLLDAPRDGIRTCIIGPAGGVPGDRHSPATGRMPQYAMIRIGDTTTDEPARVTVHEIGHVFPGDLVTPPLQARIAKLSDPSAIAIDGMLAQPTDAETGATRLADATLRMVLANPTDSPIEIRPKLSSDATAWNFHAGQEVIRLEPGQRARPKFALHSARRYNEVAPPELELAVSLPGDAGRSPREFAVKRRIPLVPSAVLTPVTKITPALWDAATPHGLWPYDASGDAAGTAKPFHVLVDGERLCVRWKVDGVRGVYIPKTEPPYALPMDAVTLAWAPAADAPVQRIVAVPFAPTSQQFLTNTGAGRKQSPLELLDLKACPATLRVTLLPTGYEAELSLPRHLVLGEDNAARVNVGVFLAERGRKSRVLTWASEEPGPSAWGTVKIVEPATTTATSPSTRPATRPATSPASPPASRPRK